MGFTLIEIVMVLVLLGILSAVAVPKYFDLRDIAAQKAAQAVVAEAQARMNGKFAAQLMAGDNCTTALTAAQTEINATNFTVDGVTTWSPDFTANSAEANVTFTMNGNNYSSTGSNYLKVQKLGVPTCGDITKTSN